MEKEIKAVKIILETGEFDKEMDSDEKESDIVSKNSENDWSRNLENMKISGDRHTVEKELQAVKTHKQYQSVLQVK